ncbi:hypothetical protein HGRIS_001984 [Hohenbuehelia grisea]|uniref:Uncharacterized protein n=1 Tax=Hohenbuehelia grisea TaxID=104357 RepID=A0ABR3JJ32_9AGAR
MPIPDATPKYSHSRAPHPTPFSASAYATTTMSGVKHSKAPIYNPFDKFTQPEFDDWIGGITSALRHALGQADESAEQSETLPNERDDASVSTHHEREEGSLASDESEGDYVEDSFAEIKARRAVSKGKARDPREGPGLGFGVKDAPIEIISDEEDEGEEEEGGEDSGNVLQEEYDDEAEEEEVDREISLDRMEETVLDAVRARKRQFERDFAEIQTLSEEEYSDEGDDADGARQSPGGADEIIELNSDGEETSPTIFNARQEDHDEEEGYEDEEDDEAGTQGTAQLLASHSSAQHIEEEYDEDARDEYDEDELYEDEIQPEEDDPEAFPPKRRGPNPAQQPPSIQDPWANVATYAEDYYAGGDRLQVPNGTNPHLISDDDRFVDDSTFLTPGVVTPSAGGSAIDDDGSDIVDLSKEDTAAYADIDADAEEPISTRLHPVTDPEFLKTGPAAESTPTEIPTRASVEPVIDPALQQLSQPPQEDPHVPPQPTDSNYDAVTAQTLETLYREFDVADVVDFEKHYTELAVGEGTDPASKEMIDLEAVFGVNQPSPSTQLLDPDNRDDFGILPADDSPAVASDIQIPDDQQISDILSAFVREDSETSWVRGADEPDFIPFDSEAAADMAPTVQEFEMIEDISGSDMIAHHQAIVLGTVLADSEPGSVEVELGADIDVTSLSGDVYENPLQGTDVDMCIVEEPVEKADQQISASPAGSIHTTLPPGEADVDAPLPASDKADEHAPQSDPAKEPQMPVGLQVDSHESERDLEEQPHELQNTVPQSPRQTSLDVSITIDSDPAPPTIPSPLSASTNSFYGPIPMPVSADPSVPDVSMDGSTTPTRGHTISSAPGTPSLTTAHAGASDQEQPTPASIPMPPSVMRMLQQSQRAAAEAEISGLFTPAPGTPGQAETSEDDDGSVKDGDQSAQADRIRTDVKETETEDAIEQVDVEPKEGGFDADQETPLRDSVEQAGTASVEAMSDVVQAKEPLQEESLHAEEILASPSSADAAIPLADTDTTEPLSTLLNAEDGESKPDPEILPMAEASSSPPPQDPSTMVLTQMPTQPALSIDSHPANLSTPRRGTILDTSATGLTRPSTPITPSVTHPPSLFAPMEGMPSPIAPIHTTDPAHSANSHPPVLSSPVSEYHNTNAGDTHGGMILTRKSTDPILHADPYPYSLSTPGAGLLDASQSDDEQDSPDVSMSSNSTQETSSSDSKEGADMDPKADAQSDAEESGDDDVLSQNNELRYPSEPMLPMPSTQSGSATQADDAESSPDLGIEDLVDEDTDADGEVDPDFIDESSPMSTTTTPYTLSIAPTKENSPVAGAVSDVQRELATPVIDPATETDPFKLMGDDSTVAPGEVSEPEPIYIPRMNNDSEKPSTPVSELEIFGDPDQLSPSRELTPLPEGLSDAPDASLQSSAKSSKRKRSVSPKPFLLKTRSMSTKILADKKKTRASKGKRTLGIKKGKAKAKATLLSDRVSEASADTSSIASTSSEASKKRGVVSRASSIASTAHSEQSSVAIHPSPTPSGQKPATPALPPPPPPPMIHTHGSRSFSFGVPLHHHGSSKSQPSPQVSRQPSSLQIPPTPKASSPMAASPSMSPTKKAQQTPTFTSSPVTRSNCRFHRIRLPSEPQEDESPPVCFLVPGCSLTDHELMEEEEIEDLGDATLEDSHRMVGDIESLDFDPYLMNVLRQLVGVDLIREHEVFWLPQPGEKRAARPAASPAMSRKGEKQHTAASSSNASLAKVIPRVDHHDDHPSSASHSRRLSIDSIASSAAARAPGSTIGSGSPTLGPSISRRGPQVSHVPSAYSTESELSEEEDDEEPVLKRQKPSSKPIIGDDPQVDAATSSPVKGKGKKLKPRRSRRLGHDNSTFKPIAEEEVSSDEEGENTQAKRRKSGAASRGVKRARAGEEIDEGDSPEKGASKKQRTQAQLSSQQDS